jgi:hypothetical protein
MLIGDPLPAPSNKIISNKSIEIMEESKQPIELRSTSKEDSFEVLSDIFKLVRH